MIHRTARLDDFERRERRAIPPDPDSNRRVFEAMYEHARRLGVLPLADPLEGLEADLRLARSLNVRRAAGPDLRGA
jgi:hypothetical protein